MKAPRWWSDAFSEVNAALGLLSTLLLTSAIFSWSVDSKVTASWLVAAAIGSIGAVLLLMYRKAARERDEAAGTDPAPDSPHDAVAELEKQP
jgi:phosphate/sulfate permease